MAMKIQIIGRNGAISNIANAQKVTVTVDGLSFVSSINGNVCIGKDTPMHSNNDLQGKAKDILDEVEFISRTRNDRSHGDLVGDVRCVYAFDRNGYDEEMLRHVTETMCRRLSFLDEDNVTYFPSWKDYKEFIDEYGAFDKRTHILIQFFM